MIKLKPLKKPLGTLGWKNFNSLASDVSIPVYALGGLSILDTEDAKKNNAYGIAGISMFINS